MYFKVTPSIDGRYWAAILLASMVGTNLGDIFPDVFHLGTLVSLILLAILFVNIVAAERVSRSGSEAFYWLAILTVRAAATGIADFLADQAHRNYLPIAIALLPILALLVALQRHASRGSRGETRLPRCSGQYWVTMLAAGTLGTILGDGLGHAFGTVQVSFPISAGLATLALAVVLAVRRWGVWKDVTNYWVAIVVVRWWGTNFGDIFKYLTSFEVSIGVTGAAMAAVLFLWRRSKTAGDMDDALPA